MPEARALRTISEFYRVFRGRYKLAEEGNLVAKGYRPPGRFSLVTTRGNLVAKGGIEPPTQGFSILVKYHFSPFIAIH
jgi:hypothetical protein